MSWALPHVGEKIKDARYFSSAGHALVRMYVCMYVCAQEEELSQHKLGLPNLFFLPFFPSATTLSGVALPCRRL